MTDVKQILAAIEQGDPKATEQLLPLVYDELRNLAIQKLGRVPSGQTLQPTALVHEAYLRLVGGGQPLWDSRGHFFAAAAEAMRRILVENARRKSSLKHGGDRGRADFDVDQLAVPELREDLLALDEALDRLAAADPEAVAASSASLLRRADARRSGKSHGYLPADGRSPVGLRTGLVAPGTRRRRIDGAAISKENGVIPPPISHYYAVT